MKKKTILLKAISLILALTFAMFAFASCNSEETPQGNAPNNDTQTPGGDDPGVTPPEQDDPNTPSDETVINFTLSGADGKSGYQLAREDGFTGTFDEYLEKFEGTDDAEKAAALKELFNTKHQLRVDENGDFKVLVLSDAQCSSLAGLEVETAGNIRTIVEREMPDLVIFNGDNCYGLNTKRAFKQYVKVMAAACEENQIPWAHVYGNHDDENSAYYSAITKEEQMEVYQSFDYCVSKPGEEDLFGLGNYVLPVFTNDGSKIAFNVWALDSGSYVDNPLPDKTFPDGNYFLGKYEYIQENQINWYMESSKLMEAYNGGKVPGMMTFHIPLQEVYTAWTQREILNLEWDGEKRDNISPCTVNCGLFDKLVERGDVKILVNSHDHLNDFSVKYKGIRFAYTACIGTEVYHADDMLGGRVINYSTKEPSDFETHMSYLQERIEVDPSAPILELVIGNDGKVSNGVAGRPVVESYDKTGSKVVSKDTTINKNVITFTPNSTMWKPTSAYLVSSSSVNEAIKDGFSFEVYFKVDNVNAFQNYVGILDYEEAGGFGLVINKSSTDPSKYVLALELAVGPNSAGRQWKTIYHDLTIGEWTHCVFSYSGPEKDTMELYVNGTLVGSLSLTADMVMPVFTGGRTPAICIGACTDSTDGARNGFAGSIAVCNIFADPITADEAKALYEASK